MERPEEIKPACTGCGRCQRTEQYYLRLIDQPDHFVVMRRGAVVASYRVSIEQGHTLATRFDADSADRFIRIFFQGKGVEKVPCSEYETCTGMKTEIPQA